MGQPDLGIDMHPIEAVNTSFPVADALHIAYVYSALANTVPQPMG